MKIAIPLVQGQLSQHFGIVKSLLCWKLRVTPKTSSAKPCISLPPMNRGYFLVG